MDIPPNWMPRDVVGELVQVLPGGRVRLNPQLIPEFSCWLILFAERWHAQRNRTNRGMNKAQRDAANAEKKALLQKIKGIEQILKCATETQSRHGFNVLMKEFEAQRSAHGLGLVVSPLISEE